MSKIKYIFHRISLFYWRFVASPEKYARHLGVKIGKHCFISTREWSNEPYLITIGDNVQVTRCVSIHTHGGGNSIRKEHPDFDVFGKVVIEDWAYIGAYSHIMPGVTIGEGALVAAGSIVTKSVAPHTVVGGNPARVIRTTEEYYEENKKYNVGTKKMSTEEKKRYLLSLPEEMFIKK
ncbi:MAG: acyltransferase [Bacteroidales bacterium]|nr:acyltransferase [Bacteroidales bacterium]